MIETRPWGSCETLAQQPGWLFKRLVVQPGKRLSLQYHNHRAEYWVVVRGQGVAQLGQERPAMHPGASLHVPVGMQHRMENTGTQEPLEVLEVQLGQTLLEDDIVRLEDDYGRAATVTTER